MIAERLSSADEVAFETGPLLPKWRQGGSTFTIIWINMVSSQWFAAQQSCFPPGPLTRKLRARVAQGLPAKAMRGMQC